MARKRRFSTFNLSFLDIMSCGFGAVVLVFLMIDHASNVHSEDVNQVLLSEVSLLEEEVLDGSKNLVLVRNTISTVDQRMAEAQGLSRQIINDIKKTEQELAFFTKDTLAQREHINQLQSDLKSLEEEKKRLEAEGKKLQGEKVRKFVGEGDRQYLTGLKLGGNRILVLLDASASMLDQTIVNIIRRRNMSDAAKLRSEKWQQAVGTVDWLLSQFPQSSWYQIYTFNSEVTPVVPGTLDEWLEVDDREQLDAAIDHMRKVIPAGPTNLEKVFQAVSQMAPRPDNIILLTDGLPTQGNRSNKANTITGKQREKLFARSIQALPVGIPVNVILAPLEGDPMAASSFWKLAIATGGSFLSPSRDWP